MTPKYIIYLFLIVSTFQNAQTRIKIMNYNVMHYPETYYYDDVSNSYIDRKYVLKNILDSYQPDIFSVCELNNEVGANQILNTALATSNNRYEKANFVVNHSSNDVTLQQLVFYNQQKLTLVFQDYITTNIRDINHYNFKLNTNVDIYLDVFVTHLKAGTTSDDQLKRWEMVSQFTSFLNNLENDSHVIFTGDFNFYNSNESGYQKIIDPTNAIAMVDPINTPGNWSNNSSFAAIHTQSPLTTNGHFHYQTGGNDGVTGGMDDRFDFIMLSQNLMNTGNLNYVPNTYKAYGNNGNCYNSYISNTACSGTYTQDLRNLLFNMSDHLPVVLELETPYVLYNNELLSESSIKIINSNVQNKELLLQVPHQFLESNYKIINYLGQTLDFGKLIQPDQNIDISYLNQGVYFLQFDNSNQILKFIKI